MPSQRIGALELGEPLSEEEENGDVSASSIELSWAVGNRAVDPGACISAYQPVQIVPLLTHTYSPRTNHRNYAFGCTLPSTLISYTPGWMIFVHVMSRHSSRFCHIEFRDARFLGTMKISRSFRLGSMTRPMFSSSDFHNSSMTTVARHRLHHFAPLYVYLSLRYACRTQLSHIRIPPLLPSLSTPAQIQAQESFTHAAAIMLFNPTTLYAAPYPH